MASNAQCRPRGEGVTLAAWARSRGVTKQRAWQWAKRGRIAGAVKRGGRWDVPPDAPAPARISYGGRPRRKAV